MTKFKKILCVLSFIIPFLIGLYFYNQLPTNIPTHWDFNGNVNGYTNKNVFVFVVPIILALGESLLIFFITKDPKYEKNKNKIIYSLSFMFMPIITIIAYIATIFVALGYKLEISKLILIIVGIILIIYGNYMPTISQNYSIGYRTSWALNDEENWNKTNRLAGKMFMITGLILILSIFTKYALFIAIPLNVIPFIYSYYLYTSKKNNF